MTATPADRTAVERQVLEIVGGLVFELGGRPRPIALDDLLDRDLGISSLERVELLLRLEQASGIRLPDSAMTDAGTPHDLARAMLLGAPGLAATTRSVTVDVPSTSTASEAVHAHTLVEAIAWHAAHSPGRVHIHLRQEDGTDRALHYGELFREASAVAGGLRASGVGGGARVVLLLRTEAAFFPAFLGTLMAGGVPVPIYPPVRLDALGEYATRQRAIIENAGARVMITFPEIERLATLIRGQVPTLEVVTTVDRLASSAPAQPVPLKADDIALIQYTSGSTGTPKGVVLSHANLLANIRAIGDAVAVEPTDVVVSWLPLYHDMGLIGAWLAPLYYGVPVALMSPLTFLARPARWLQAMHAYRGTISPAPNFAYDIAARKVSDEDMRGVDLSRWRLAFNGAELVSPDTIERFTTRFAPYGFRPEAMCPVYGLAEASVGLTASPRGRAPRVDEIAREPFERARAIVPAGANAPNPLRLVSCGVPMQGHEIAIQDGEGQTCEERREGHVWFRGPSVSRGYFGHPPLPRPDGWVDSGDLGYLASGELFITGRAKDVIIVGGRNFSAQEAEDVAGAVSGVRQGCVAAFGVSDPARGTERLVIVAETRERDADARERIRQDVLSRVTDALGVPPDDIVVTGPGAVLKTSSGKIRRSATRDAYRDGTLGRRQTPFSQWRSLAAGVVADRVRRLGCAAGRLALTAWILLILLLAAPALWIGLRLVPRGRRVRHFLRYWSRTMFRLCGVLLEYEGFEHLHNTDARLIVANHSSYLDPLALLATLPGNVVFAAKRGLLNYPLIGLAIERAEYATIERGDVQGRLAGAEAVASRLAAGERLVVFPEGTFVRAPGLLPFRLGAFRAAVEAGRPIVPVAIRGTRDVLPEGAWLFTPGRIAINVGEPIPPAAIGWPEMVRLRDAAREWIGSRT